MCVCSISFNLEVKLHPAVNEIYSRNDCKITICLLVSDLQMKEYEYLKFIAFCVVS